MLDLKYNTAVRLDAIQLHLFLLFLMLAGQRTHAVFYIIFFYFN